MDISSWCVERGRVRRGGSLQLVKREASNLYVLLVRSCCCCYCCCCCCCCCCLGGLPRGLEGRIYTSRIVGTGLLYSYTALDSVFSRLARSCVYRVLRIRHQ